MVDPSAERPGLFQRLWRGAASERIRTARYPIHAYGKLPIYKDFISTGLTDPGAREFRNWLDRGFSHRWSVDENYREAEIPSYSFLFRLADGKGCVAGSLWGSSDEGGLRKFPFTLFLSFPSGQPAADPLTALEYLTLLERRARELRDRFGPGASLASLYQSYRGAEFECPLKSPEQIFREAREGLSQVALSEFAESLLGESMAPSWPAFLGGVAAVCDPSFEGAGAIRLPLGGALPRLRELEFWLLWIARQDRKRKRPVCGLLYPNGTGPGRAVLLFRDLRAEDILLLHPTRADYANVLEVAPPAPPEPEVAVSAPAESVVATTPAPAPATIAVSEAAGVVPVPGVPAEVAPVPAESMVVEGIAATALEPVEPAREEKVGESPSAGPPLSDAEPVTDDRPPAPQIDLAPHQVGTPGGARLTQPPFDMGSEPVSAQTQVAAHVIDPPVPVAESLPSQPDSADRSRLTQAPFDVGSESEAVEMVLEPGLSSGVRARLTQPPFDLGPDAVAPEPVDTPAPLAAEPLSALEPATESLSARAEAPAPLLEAPPASPAAAPAAIDPALPEAPPALAVEPAPARPVSGPLPPGWDRPLFALLEG